MTTRSYYTLYFVITMIITALCVFPNEAVVGVWKNLFSFIGGSVLGMVGFFIGDFIRKFALPDAFFTTGGLMSIIKTKLFWLCGPQLIGILIGALIGAGFINNL